MFITATEAKLQAQGQVRQRSEIQMGQRYRMAGRHSGQAAGVKNQEDEKKRGWEKTGADRTNAGKLDKQDELATDKQRIQV